MERSLLLNQDMNDIVFEHRNKSYGAFVLRHDYESNMAKAMLSSFLLFVLCIASPLLYRYFKGDSLSTPEITYTNNIVTLENYEKKPVIKQPIVKTDPTPQQPKSTLKFVPPVVVRDNEDIHEETPPGVDELANVEIGTVTQQNEYGTVDVDLIIENPGSESAVDLVPEPEVFYSYAVQQQPEFPDGLDAMYKFLKKNLEYTSLAKENGIAGTVYVQFVVSKEGKIEKAKVVRGVGGGLDQEALRVINLMPYWKPGKHNGKTVAVNFTLPIKFQLLK